MQMRAIHKKRKHGGGSDSSPGPADTAAPRPAPAPAARRGAAGPGRAAPRRAALRGGSRALLPGWQLRPAAPRRPAAPSGARTAQGGVAAAERGAVGPKLRGHPNFLAIKEVSERPAIAFHRPEGLPCSLPYVRPLFLPQRFVFLFFISSIF